MKLTTSKNHKIKLKIVFFDIRKNKISIFLVINIFEKNVNIIQTQIIEIQKKIEQNSENCNFVSRDFFNKIIIDVFLKKQHKNIFKKFFFYKGFNYIMSIINFVNRKKSKR